ncbi:unnamed protein product, partial [marine sediment metagenome]
GIFAIMFYYISLMPQTVKKLFERCRDGENLEDILSPKDNELRQVWTLNNVRMDVRLEKLAIILFLLYLVGIFGACNSNLLLSWAFPGPGMEDAFTIRSRSISLARHFIGLILSIGTSVWLFLRAKRDNNSAFFWSILGFFIGVFTIILYYLFSLDTLLDVGRNEKEDNPFV